MFVDIHTHNSLKSNFPAVRNLNFPEAEELFLSNAKGFFSVGFHPWFADEYSIDVFSKLEKWADDSRFVAIGECGLDKNSKVSIDKQLHVLEQQISVSEKAHKPLIIHCVGCFNELFDLKKRMNPHQLWIIHGFRGKPELAVQALKAGCALSFGEHFNEESVRVTPVDKLFVETDESHLLIAEMYRRIALVKDVEPDWLRAGELFYMNFIAKQI
jgi:TatD DNase family protein